MFHARRRVIATTLVVLLAFVWPLPSFIPASAAVTRPVSGSGTRVKAASVSLRPNTAQKSLPSQDISAVGSCVSNAGLVTPTPTASPTATASPTPTSTATASPTASTTPTPTAAPANLPANCIASVSPAVAFNSLGQQHTVTFLCGNAAAVLTPPGCFNVRASVTDMTTGLAAPFQSAVCASIPVTSTTADCTNVANPICPVGFRSINGTSCTFCPVGSSQGVTQAFLNTCTTSPVNNTCPPGSTPFNGAGGLGGGAITCFVPSLPLTPTSGNEVTVTINSTEPHPYLINFTGYVGTTSSGACPVGTTLSTDVTLPLSTGGTGHACAFSLYAQKKYVEATKLTIVPESGCSGSITATAGGMLGGTPCLFKVTATGMVVLKSGVNCSDGTEPASGSPAPADFPGDVITGIAPVYECTNGVLSVTGIGVPNLPLTLTSANGQLSPFCIPQSRVPTAVPTPSATETGNGFPTAIPTSTATPVPTATSAPGTVAPAPTSIPTPTSFEQLAFCVESGASTLVTATNSSGVAGNTPVDISAEVSGFPNRTVSATGTFLSGGSPIPGVGMYVTLFYSLQATPSYCPPSGSPTYTDASGSATCITSTDGQPFGEFVPTDVSFVANCLEYGIHTGFFVGQPASAVDLAHFPDPFCVLRTGTGPVTINATFTSDLNTQPSLTTGNVQLGAFGLPTATPVPTAVPTDTPVVVPTNTPMPTSTLEVTPSATATDTATATVTSTPVAGPLNFSVTAARVSNVKNPGNRQGLDTVRQGQKVWLMLYYRVKRLPSNLSRTTIYTVQLGTRRMFKVTYKATQPVTETGNFVRYTVFTMPRNAAYGTYMFKGTLALGGQSQTKSWKFAVVRYSSVARSRQALLLRLRETLRR